jgi:NNP family nitrate/nitrite transporter-like MFS transporter
MPAAKSTSSPLKALILATLALTVNFWAWSLLGPLGLKIATELSLDPIKLSVLLAVPVLVGSLARIPLGTLTDRLGGHRVFSAACFAAVIPIVMLAFASTYNDFLVGGTLLGITGATFAIGIPYINSWSSPKNKGMMLGIYSMGNAGTALSGFFTPFLAATFGRTGAYLTVAAILLFTGILFTLRGKNSPSWKKTKSSFLKSFGEAVKEKTTWDLSILYFVSFGAFVAFGVYLPTLLKVSFGLSLTDAAARAAGFILLATIARPIGGLLSDRINGKIIVRVVFVAIAILSAFIAFQPTLAPTTTAAYLSLAFTLGLGNGAVFALVGKLTEPNKVGSVTGVVGALGGLGGFLPPLILGVTYQKTHSYSLALLGLSIASAVVFFYINNRFKNLK